MPAVAKPQPAIVGRNNHRSYADARDLLREVSYADKHRRVLRPSFCGKDGIAHPMLEWIRPYSAARLAAGPPPGAATRLAILAQFSFFANANADALRPLLVAHGGERRVVADAGPQTLDTVDVGAVAQRMAALLRTHLADSDVTDWLLPGLSTTLPHDRATAAMVFLRTM